MASSQTVTVDNLAQVLENDNMVKLAGVDVDGILRGKLVSKKKFLSIAEAGFGFCSVIFGWDMHDRTYVRELKISNAENGYHDLLAIPDLSTFRRIPWEDNVPLFLVDFLDPDTQKPICACPRGLVKTQLAKLKEHGYGAMAGAEYEFYQFKTPDPSSSSPAAYLQDNPPHQLPALTEGMFGYSLTRPVHNQDYYYDVFNTCAKFSCNIEGWHTESGPGVFEAALEFGEIAQMADRAALFKYVVKSVSTKYGITPCFMAKPKQGLPGNSGHMHVSIVDKEGKNLFARETKDENPKWRDIANLSDMTDTSSLVFLSVCQTSCPFSHPQSTPTSVWSRTSGPPLLSHGVSSTAPLPSVSSAPSPQRHVSKSAFPAQTQTLISSSPRS
ncbi:hypothetical protein NXS19_000206 [Fusarium pseudograminearum]|nr:hypothetical protein NXS19_000206 [Fusarium pseudograminearum]